MKRIAFLLPGCALVFALLFPTAGALAQYAPADEGLPPPRMHGRMPPPRAWPDAAPEQRDPWREQRRQQRMEWRQMSPEERHQLRQDIREAGRHLYPRGHGMRGNPAFPRPPDGAPASNPRGTRITD